MAFIKYGAPAQIKIAHVCEFCKQPKPLIRITFKGMQKSACAECARQIKNDKS